MTHAQAGADRDVAIHLYPGADHGFYTRGSADDIALARAHQCIALMTGPADTSGALLPGAVWISEGRTLTEADLSWSSMTSGDWHPIHADAEYAVGTKAGQRIFHGTYGVHLAFGMATRFPPRGDAVIAALGFSEWKYKAPLCVGDTVRVRVCIQAVRPTSDGRRAVVERHIQLLRGASEVVQEGVAVTLIRQDKQE